MARNAERADGHPADELAAVPADEDMSPVLRSPYAAENGLVSGPSAGMGVGGDEHGDSRYRGTARQLTWPAGAGAERRPARAAPSCSSTGPRCSSARRA